MRGNAGQGLVQKQDVQGATGGGLRKPVGRRAPRVVEGTCAFAYRSGIFAACTLRMQGRVVRVEDKSGALWWFTPGKQGTEAEPFARRAAPKAAAMPDLPTCKRRDKCHITKTTQAGVRTGVRAGGQVGVWQAWGRRAYLLDTRQTRPLAEESAICRLPMARQNGPGVDRQVSEESCLFRRQQPVLMQLARRVYRRVCDNNRMHAMKPKSLPKRPRRPPKRLQTIP